jgi:capsular exopolysaccharide synthesis family protein
MNEASSVGGGPGASRSAFGEFILEPDVVVMSDPSGSQAEAIRTLRTHLIARHVRDGRRGLAICAASRKVGCTFVAVNLAIALSQIGNKTLLVDGDLRDPGVDRMIVPPANVPGLSQCLTSPKASIGDCIQHDVLPGLSILYAGGTMSNPQELLAAEGFRTLADLCMRDYDVTIVDTPPGNICADARIISGVVGYSLLVARRDHSFVQDQMTFAKELSADRAELIGTVMNEM